jgi:tetratricopeptide (TPR) repeat protein
MPTARLVSPRRFAALAALCIGQLVLVAPVATGAAPDAPAATPAADERSDYTAAQTLFHDRKFKEAIALLDPFVAAHPRDARALTLRGDCKADLGDNEGALKDYNAAIAVAPEYEYAYVTRCETRLALDDKDGALRDCDTAVRLEPADGLAFEDRADVQFQREAYDLALGDYDKAIALGRSTAYIFAARCDTNRLTGKLERARADCEKALAIDPKSRRGLWARGRLAIVEKRYVDGIADLNAYIAQNPKSSDVAYYFRGLAYNRIEKFRLALEDMRVYVLRRPNDPDGYRERAMASYATGDASGALADLANALKGYRRDGDRAAADRVTAMTNAVRAGKPLPP